MRKLVLLVCAVLAAGLVLMPVASVLAAGKTHEVTGTVVSVDTQGKKLTIKDESGTSITAPVLDPALSSLKSLKAGDHVILTCQDKENGDHEGVSAIKMAKAAEAPKQ